MTPYFFGYGSLVNVETHDYPDTKPAQLRGWRRAWVRTALRNVVFLTAIPDVDSTIDGLIAAVPNGDWDALDLRERGYKRQPSGAAIIHELNPAPTIAHYVIPPEMQATSGDHMILRSYLDVVVQGYLRVFGEDGVARFFETTNGWYTPVLDDRNDPIYPRAQVLSAQETALVDHFLAQLTPEPTKNKTASDGNWG